jgi:hypothetical protein
MYCYKCGAENPDRASCCISCGYVFPISRPTVRFPGRSTREIITQKNQRFWIGALIVLGGFVLMWFIDVIKGDNSFSGSTSRLAVSHTDTLTLSDFNTSVVETNDTYAKVSWQVTVTNHTNVTQTCYIQIKVKDSSGFVIDDALSQKAIIPANEAVVESDYMLLSGDVRKNAVKFTVGFYH